MTATDPMRLAETSRPESGTLQVMRIARALLWATPFHVLLCGALYILSQISLLAAILLPWKLLAVMTTGGVSGIIPDALRRYPDRELVMILAASAGMAFALYTVAEVSIGLVCRHGSALVLGRHQKVGLFDGHRRQAGGLYRGFLRAVSAVLAILVIASCLAWLYPALLLALSSYLLMGLAWVVWRMGRAPATPTPALAPEMRSNAWWGIGFLYAVAWVIVDYGRGSLPDLTTTFVALLLLRQSVVLSGMVWRTYALFERQRPKAGALFLRDVPWNPAPRTDNACLGLAEPERRQVWVRDLLHRHHDVQGQVIITECRVGDSGRLVSLTVQVEADGASCAFLLRLFHSAREEAAQHEQDILEAASPDWPAPVFLASHHLEGHRCLVYDWQGPAYWMSATKRAARLPDLRAQLLARLPAGALLTRYGRSRPHLADRLNSVDWDHLQSIIPARVAANGAQLRLHWVAICELARSLPRQVVIPRLHIHRIGCLNGVAVICNWTRWQWEPVGAGWPLRTDVAGFDDALRRAAGQRADLAIVSASQARLMAHLYEFERLWRLRSHARAVKLITALADAARGCGFGTAKTDPAETDLVKAAPVEGALSVQ